MSTNITTAFKSGDGVIVSPQVVSTTDNAGNSIAVTLPHVTRILAVHAYSTVAGTFDIGDKNGSKIKFGGVQAHVDLLCDKGDNLNNFENAIDMTIEKFKDVRNSNSYIK